MNVLFVCMGNICRSPTAHGVFRQLVKQQGLAQRIDVDSAGTHAYHIGEPPDARSMQTARARGVEINDLRARRVNANDYSVFDYVLAMDRDNYEGLQQACPEKYQHKLKLFMDYAPSWPQNEVPDPYYGGVRGFDDVFDMVQAASEGLFSAIQQQLDSA